MGAGWKGCANTKKVYKARWARRLTLSSVVEVTSKISLHLCSNTGCAATVVRGWERAPGEVLDLIHADADAEVAREGFRVASLGLLLGLLLGLVVLLLLFRNEGFAVLSA